MRVALVHDWLTGMRGGERCLEAFLQLYPDADIFTMIHIPGATSSEIDQRVVETSFLNRLPNIQKYYRLMLPLYPKAVSAFDFREYDFVISLSHAAAKNIRVPSSVPHISYCFTPMRYIWDQAATYFGKATPFLWPEISHLRSWDRKSSEGVSHFVAISRFISGRIRCFYKRRSSVIYPPVRNDWITPAQTGTAGEAFLYAGALVPYKRVDLVVEAFNRTGDILWVVGDGPMYQNLRRNAGPNIQFFGRIDDASLAEAYRRCRALIFPAKEDFGLIPVECMAAGRPVIALGEGGAAETVKGVRSPYLPFRTDDMALEEATGVFFRDRNRNTLNELVGAIQYFQCHEQKFSVDRCVNQARAFSPESFYDAWNKLMQSFETIHVEAEAAAV